MKTRTRNQKTKDYDAAIKAIENARKILNDLADEAKQEKKWATCADHREYADQLGEILSSDHGECGMIFYRNSIMAEYNTPVIPDTVGLLKNNLSDES